MGNIILIQNMSGVHYCFIARDSDMLVFEKLVNKSLN